MLYFKIKILKEAKNLIQCNYVYAELFKKNCKKY
jgi:hypothetical protein